MRLFLCRTILPIALVFIVFEVRGQEVPATRTYEYDAQGNRVSASQLLRIPGLQIHAFQPPSGLPGDVINIYGRNLLQAENLSVTIQGKPATILRRADLVIQVQVPLDADTGPVMVSVSSGTPVELGTYTIRRDLDRDGDKLPNFLEILLGLDPDNPDTDNNGVMDGDEDFDNDHLSNYGEIVMGTSVNNPDTAGDGILDGDYDTDNDELTDGEEIRLGTDPRNADTDGDIWPDGFELITHGDPLDPNLGSRLYQAPARPIHVVAPDIGTSNQQGNLYIAQPRVYILLPDIGEGIYQTNITTAQPPVKILLPDIGGAGDAPLNVMMAKPPVSILLPDIGQAGDVSANLYVAKPPVQVLLPDQGSSQNVPPNLTVGKPPVLVKIEPQ